MAKDKDVEQLIKERDELRDIYENIGRSFSSDIKRLISNSNALYDKIAMSTIDNSSKTAINLTSALKKQLDSTNAILEKSAGYEYTNIGKAAKGLYDTAQKVGKSFIESGTTGFDKYLSKDILSKMKGLQSIESQLSKKTDDASKIELISIREILDGYRKLALTQDANLKYHMNLKKEMSSLKPVISEAFGPLLKIDSVLQKSGIGRTISSIFDFSGIKSNFEENVLNGIKQGKGSILSMKGAFTSLASGMKESFASTMKFMTSTAGILMLIGTIIHSIVKGLEKYQKDWREIMDATGLMKDEGEYLVKQSYDIAKNYGQLGINAEVAKKAGIALIQEFGSLNFAKTAEQSEALQMNVGYAAANLGLAVDDGARLTRLFGSMTKLTPKLQINLMRATAALSKAAGVPAGKVLADMAKSSEVINKYFRGNLTEAIKTTVYLHKMGLELKNIDSISSSLMDWEGNIEASMEASVLMGRQVDMNRARMLMMKGDMSGMSKEVLRQVGSLDQFNKSNVIQKQALAKATGLSVDELTKALTQEERMRNATSAQKENYKKIMEQVDNITKGKEQSIDLEASQLLASEKYNASVGKIQQVWQNLVVRLAPTFLTIIEVVASIIGTIADGVNSIFTLFGLIKDDLSAGAEYSGQLNTGIEDVSKSTSGVIKAISTVKAGFKSVLGVILAIGIGLPLIVKGIGGIASKVSGLFTMLKTGWSTIFNTMSQIGPKSASMWDSITKGASGMKDSVAGAFKFISDSMKESKETGTGFVKTIGEKLKTKFAKKPQTIVEQTMDSNLGETIPGKAKEQLEKTTDSVDTIAKKGKEKTPGFSTFKQTMTNLGDGIRALFDRIKWGDLLKLAAFTVILLGAAYGFGRVAKTFDDVSWESMSKAAVGMAGLYILTKLMTKLKEKEVLQFGVFMLALSASIGLLGMSLKVFNDIDWESLAKAGVAIIGLTALIAGLGAIMSTGIGALLIGFGTVALLAMAVGLAAVGGAMYIVSEAMPGFDLFLSSITKLDPMKLIGVAAGIGAIGISLIALTAGTVVNSIGNFVSKLFGGGENIFDQLNKLASIGDKLNTSASAIKKLTSELKELASVKSGNLEDTIDSLSDVGNVKINIAEVPTKIFTDSIAKLSNVPIDVTNLSNLMSTMSKMNDFNPYGIKVYADSLSKLASVSTDIDKLAASIKVLTYEMKGLATVDYARIDSLIQSTSKLTELQGSGISVTASDKKESPVSSKVVGDDRITKLLERIAFSLENTKNDIYIDSKKVGSAIKSNERKPSEGGHNFN